MWGLMQRCPNPSALRKPVERTQLIIILSLWTYFISRRQGDKTNKTHINAELQFTISRAQYRTDVTTLVTKSCCNKRKIPNQAATMQQLLEQAMMRQNWRLNIQNLKPYCGRLKIPCPETHAHSHNMHKAEKKLKEEAAKDIHKTTK